MIAKLYLLAYNAALILGWGYVLFLAGTTFAAEGSSAVYGVVEWPLLYAQTAAVMEVLHAMVGIARSPVLVTAMQVSSRLMVVWGVLYVAPPSHTATLPLFSAGGAEFGLGVPSLMFAWGVTEVIRYGFYFFKLLGSVPYVITWMRYTFFIVLYPIGVSSELFLAYSGYDHIVRSGALSYPMPNPYNVSIHFPTVMIVFFAGYLPGFPMLYTYMLGQRKSVLAPKKKKTA